jgi:hypothetical protein
VPDVDLNAAINSAYLEIVGKFAFSETRAVSGVTTVVGTNEYPLPVGLVILRRVWDMTNSRKLSKRSTRFLASWKNTETNNQPTDYIRLASSIMLFPIPDGIYTIMLEGVYVEKLVADSDVPVIPATWHDGILLRARWYYFDTRGDVGKAIYASNTYKDWLSDKPSEIDEEKVDLDDRGVIVGAGPEYRRGQGSQDLRYDTDFDREDWR